MFDSLALTLFVMAVLDTTIHLAAGFRGWRRRRNVGTRVKLGHDGWGEV